MKTTNKIKSILFIIGLILIIGACDENFLEEIPPSSFSTVGVLKSPSGFETYITALHQSARNEMATRDGNMQYYIMHGATDVASFGHAGLNSNSYMQLLSPTAGSSSWNWDWAYTEMIMLANTIIDYAEKSDLEDIWENVEQKNAIIAEAKFFRAYTYNFLANVFGRVPIIDKVYESPKVDFVRSDTRNEVLEFARQDLEFASEWLPTQVVKEGRIVKAAADHLLTEVYISLGLYDKAVLSANKVINSGLYQLMTQRFGTEKDKPGDVFSDMFKDGNQNRSSGNLESIYVWQFEDMTPGGQGGSNGNNRLRKWGPWYSRLLDPNGKAGMVVDDSIGRGTGQVRPSNYFLYDIWKSDWDNDIRNSEHNIRREWYYNHPSSAYYGQKVNPGFYTTETDTMQNLYPQIRKIEGKVGTLTHTSIGLWSGRTYDDFMVYRLAETYLLRAEAYFRMGDLINASNDINVVRARANATLIEPSQVTEEYILDERARELITEEPRRRTLVRMGLLVDRAKKYSMRAVTRESIQEFHQWFPIPQTSIDANFGAVLEQNPGY